MIDEKKLLKKLKKEYETAKARFNECEDCDYFYAAVCSALETTMKLVEREPSITTEKQDNGWIKCNKDLPTESGFYYITDYHPLKNELMATILYYDADRKTFCLPKERWYEVKPIAWMREPEPYKEV